VNVIFESSHTDKSLVFRMSGLLTIILGSIVLVSCFPKLAQDPNYHLFADAVSLLGINNGSNVISNAGFVIAGLIGIYRIRNEKANLSIWRFFFCAVACVGVGSAYYHWLPSNDTLLWDRLPMTLSFAALVAGISQERFGCRAGRLLLVPLVLCGSLSVLYWWLTEQAGAGDLRPYILVQFLPMLLIPLVVILFPKDAHCDRPYWTLLAFYILAKFFEWQDLNTFVITGHLISGHALKHLIAATGLLLFKPHLFTSVQDLTNIANSLTGKKNFLRDC
jgi:hypothetical membrane protein